MAHNASSKNSFIQRHKARLQAIALLLILVLPFMLYGAAQSGQSIIVLLLLGTMTLVMTVIVLIG
jgi:energy-coupling factor transporter transmembrane protein EcfT